MWSIRLIWYASAARCVRTAGSLASLGPLSPRKEEIERIQHQDKQHTPEETDDKPPHVLLPSTPTAANTPYTAERGNR
jgi:hypothetical protein